MKSISLGQDLPDVQLVDNDYLLDKLFVGYVVVAFENELLTPLVASGFSLAGMLAELVCRIERERDLVTVQQGVYSSFRSHLWDVACAVATARDNVIAQKTA